MLNKSNRLNKDKDFKYIFKKTRPIYSGNLSLRCLRSGSEMARFGFVISNKIDKRSTRRNAIKRKLRALAGEQLSNIGRGWRIVVMAAKPYSFPLDYNAIRYDFIKGLEKANVLSKKDS